jgi:hypothetical protein
VHPNQAALSSNHRVVTLSGDSVAGGGAWDTIPFGKRVDPLIKVGTVPNPEKPNQTLYVVSAVAWASTVTTREMEAD